MSTTKPNALLQALSERGLIAQMSADAELHQHLSTGSRTLYAGFDPTAESLHIGHLVPMLVLRRFQLAGHRPIAVVGGATGMIGDPSFKAAERSLLSAKSIEQNVAGLKSQLAQYLDVKQGSPALMVNNADWTKHLNILAFLRDIGKHFSINTMIQKESVKQRIEREGEGISFTEFAYMILQSYDFACLYKQYDCTLQIGGSDQWGNITSGIDLTRRLHQGQVYGLTLPLVTKADGSKFGKTETGTVWLDARRTSPYAFYQFWINTADADVYKFLRYFTFLSPEVIVEIERSDAESIGKPEAQTILAREVTRFIHGEAGLAAAQRISQALFTESLSGLNADDLGQLALDSMPGTYLEADSILLVDALVQSGLAKSKGQAREFISNGAVSLNGKKCNDVSVELLRKKALFNRYFVLKRGKKQFHLLYWH